MSQSTIFQLCRDVFMGEPVLSNEDEGSCSRTPDRAPGGIPTGELAIESSALYHLS